MMRLVGPLTRPTHCHSLEKQLVVVPAVQAAETPDLSEWSLQLVQLRSRWSETALKSMQMLVEEVKTMWRWVLKARTRWKWAAGTQQTRRLCGTFESWRALLPRCREARPCHPCLTPGSMLRHIRRRVVEWLPEMHVLGTAKMLGNGGLVILVLSEERGHFGGKPGRMKGRVRAPLLGRPL